VLRLQVSQLLLGALSAPGSHRCLLCAARRARDRAAGLALAGSKHVLQFACSFRDALPSDAKHIGNKLLRHDEFIALQPIRQP
jgi:hypothetical protein